MATKKTIAKISSKVEPKPVPAPKSEAPKPTVSVSKPAPAATAKATGGGTTATKPVIATIPEAVVVKPSGKPVKAAKAKTTAKAKETGDGKPKVTKSGIDPKKGEPAIGAHVTITGGKRGGEKGTVVAYGLFRGWYHARVKLEDGQVASVAPSNMAKA